MCTRPPRPPSCCLTRKPHHQPSLALHSFPVVLGAAAVITAYLALKPVPHDDDLHTPTIGAMPAEGRGSTGGKAAAGVSNASKGQGEA